MNELYHKASLALHSNQLPKWVVCVPLFALIYLFDIATLLL